MAYRGISVNKSSSNLYEYSRYPKDQTVTVTSGSTYTVTAEGPHGSFILSGAVGASPVTVTDASPYTFVASSTSLVVTVVGDPYHLQVEAGPDSTSPIWTTNSSATRGAESITISGLQAKGALGASAGGFVLDVERMVASSSGGTWFGLSAAGSTVTQDGIRFQTDSSGVNIGNIRMSVYDDSVVIGSKTIAYTSVNTANGAKIAITWSGTTFKMAVNGVIEYTATLTASMPTLDALELGSSTAFVTIRKFSSFDRLLTDSELISETS